MAEFNIRLGAASGKPAHWQPIAKDGEPLVGTDFRMRLPNKRWGRVVDKNASSGRALFVMTDTGWETVCWIAPSSAFTFPSSLTGDTVLIRTFTDPFGTFPVWHFDSRFTLFRGMAIGNTADIEDLFSGQYMLGGHLPVCVVDYKFIKNHVVGDQEVKAADLVVTASAGPSRSFNNPRSDLVDPDLASAELKVTLSRRWDFPQSPSLVGYPAGGVTDFYLIPDLVASSGATAVPVGTAYIQPGYEDIVVHTTTVTDRLNSIPYGPRTIPRVVENVPEDDPELVGYGARMDFTGSWSSSFPGRIWQVWAYLNFELRIIT